MLHHRTEALEHGSTTRLPRAHDRTGDEQRFRGLHTLCGGARHRPAMDHFYAGEAVDAAPQNRLFSGRWPDYRLFFEAYGDRQRAKLVTRR